MENDDDHNDWQEESRSFLDNHYCWITSQNNQTIVQEYQIQKVLGLKTCPRTMEEFYQLIFDHETNKSGYLSTRIRLFDEAFVQMVVNQPHIKSEWRTAYLSTEFLIKNGSEETMKIQKGTFISKISRSRKIYNVSHDCLCFPTRCTLYIPEPVQILHIKYGDRLYGMEQLLLKQAAPELIGALPLTSSELDNCEYFANGVKESKEIAKERRLKPLTIDTQRSTAIAKGKTIAPGLNNFSVLCQFLKADGII